MVTNHTYNVLITCSDYVINDTQTLALHQMYMVLANDSGVILISDEGLMYSNSNGDCRLFGDRRKTAALIVGLTMGVICLLLFAAIGGFLWYRNRDVMAEYEKAPLRV